MIYIILSERGEVMNLGQRLIELRKAKHLSQEEVAEKLNVTRQTISNGKPIKVLQNLIKYFHYVNYLKYLQMN